MPDLPFFEPTDGTLNAEKYEDILSKSMLKASKKLFGKKKWKVLMLSCISLTFFCFLFQADNASSHTAKSIKTWLRDHSVNTVNWVPNSPDLNSMENLHNIWKDRVAAHRPRNKSSLKG